MKARMNHNDLTQGEQNALRRVAAGSEVDPSMWQDLFKRGLVERRQGNRALSQSGRAAVDLMR